MVRNVDYPCGFVYAVDIDASLSWGTDAASLNVYIAQVTTKRLTVVRRVKLRVTEPAMSRISTASAAKQIARQELGPRCESVQKLCGISPERGLPGGLRDEHWHGEHEGTALQQYRAATACMRTAATRSAGGSWREHNAEPEATLDPVILVASQEAWYLACGGASAVVWRDRHRTSARWVVMRCADSKRPCADAREYITRNRELLAALEWVTA